MAQVCLKKVVVVYTLAVIWLTGLMASCVQSAVGLAFVCDDITGKPELGMCGDGIAVCYSGMGNMKITLACRACHSNNK